MVLIPIVWQPRRVHESGAGSLCCLSARMCEFMATPLSCARRGNPGRFESTLSGLTATLLGVPILWAAKNWYKKRFLIFGCRIGSAMKFCSAHSALYIPSSVVASMLPRVVLSAGHGCLEEGGGHKLKHAFGLIALRYLLLFNLFQNPCLC
jgi:hypothetical protein